MGYAEELEDHAEVITRLWEEKQAAEAAARTAAAAYEGAIAKKYQLEALLRGERPYLVGTTGYRGGDMMGKGGTTTYGQEIVWAKEEPYNKKRRGRYTYAVELEDDMKTYRALTYLNDEYVEIDLKAKKALLDLPENPDWDDTTKKIRLKWQNKLDELRELLA